MKSSVNTAEILIADTVPTCKHHVPGKGACSKTVTTLLAMCCGHLSVFIYKAVQFFVFYSSEATKVFLHRARE